MAPCLHRRVQGFAVLGLVALLNGWLFGDKVNSTFAMMQPSAASPQETPEMSKFRVGDRVRARVPILVSNQGRGYYNEGAGQGVPKHLRNMTQERGVADSWEWEELDGMLKVIEGGSEGYVVGIITAGEWMNRPPHWKGQPRPGIMVWALALGYLEALLT
eukprot:s2044_g5.t1